MNGSSKRDLKPLRSIQNAMVEAVRNRFSASEVEALRVVVRLTVEFRKGLDADKINNYIAASVFSGIDSFVLLVHAYGVLEQGGMRTALQWELGSVVTLKREFRSLYRRFIAQKSFEAQCRTLLDLFKLQLALAAMAYDCDND